MTQELKEQVAELIRRYDSDYDDPDELTDRILALPQIAEVLETHEIVMVTKDWGRPNPTAPSKGPDQRL